MADQLQAQRKYHVDIFHAVHNWKQTHGRIVDLSGDDTPEGLLGLDQLGHFGPNGCDLVVEFLAPYLPRSARVVEFGSGFGGALRSVVDGLAHCDVNVTMAAGVELLLEHAQVSRVISTSQQRAEVTELVGASTAVPLHDSAVDGVVITGSMPHFVDAAGTLREAARVLLPGGVIVITEEVSILGPECSVSDDFRRLHPKNVFFLATREERLRQLSDAGFVDVQTSEVTEWACDLLHDRLKAIKLFRGTAESIFGEGEVDTIVKTLTVARAEYLARRLIPTVIVARTL